MYSARAGGYCCCLRIQKQVVHNTDSPKGREYLVGLAMTGIMMNSVIPV